MRNKRMHLLIISAIYQMFLHTYPRTGTTQHAFSELTQTIIRDALPPNLAPRTDPFSSVCLGRKTLERHERGLRSLDAQRGHYLRLFSFLIGHEVHHAITESAHPAVTLVSFSVAAAARGTTRRDAADCASSW